MPAGLLDHQAAGAETIRDAYTMRWTASETTIGENKATVTGAGPATTPCLRSGEPALIWQEFWAWLAATHPGSRNPAPRSRIPPPPSPPAKDP